MTDLFSVSPILAIFATPLLIMLLTAIWPNFSYALHVAFAGVAIGLVLAVLSLVFFEHANSPFFVFFVGDIFSKVCQAAMLACVLFVLVLSRDWFAISKQSPNAFAILMLLSLVGAMALVMSTHFMSFFVSLELLSIPVYAMIAYEVSKRKGLEAALKYILLAGFSVAILLFGMALIYAQFGSLVFDSLVDQPMNTVALIGFALFFVGVAFKIGLVPFHMWLPDVYEGAPLPVTAYLATVSKGAVLFFVMRFLSTIGIDALWEIASIIAALAVLSMFIGSIMALKQQNVKRLLAFSSVAQVGYMLIGILGSDSKATLFYIFAYFAAVLCALGALAVHSRFDAEKETVKSLDGLYFYKPSLAIALTIALLSFTGLPLTVGFLSKFFVLSAAMDSGQWILAVSLALSSAIGFYAYFKVILAMATRGTLSIIPMPRRFSLSQACVVGLAVVIIGLGVWPWALDEVTTIAKLESSDQ
jgi:NADH-quinone oxidoreductase subunit N